MEQSATNKVQPLFLTADVTNFYQGDSTSQFYIDLYPVDKNLFPYSVEFTFSILPVSDNAKYPQEADAVMVFDHRWGTSVTPQKKIHRINLGLTSKIVPKTMYIDLNFFEKSSDDCQRFIKFFQNHTNIKDMASFYLRSKLLRLNPV